MDMLAILLPIVLMFSSPGHAQDPGLPIPPCSQPGVERDSLIREAMDNQYWVRRVEFVGNEHTRDYVLRREVVLVEGDVFTRASLVKSLARVSKLRRYIYPVKLKDVIVLLDRPNKAIDFAICFKEKRAPSRRARSAQF